MARGPAPLRAYLKAIRSGATTEVAAGIADVSIEVARLYDQTEAEGGFADIKVKIELRGSNQAEANAQLREGIERIQRLTEEKKGIQDDIKLRFQEMVAAGFNKKMIQNTIKFMEMDPAERAEFDEQFELYREAMGIE